MKKNIFWLIGLGLVVGGLGVGLVWWLLPVGRDQASPADRRTGGNGFENGIAVTAQPVGPSEDSLQEQGDTISINFTQCSPGMRRFYVAQGSTTVDVKGKVGSSCHLDYGGEIENPKWDGRLTTSCRVPTDLGTLTFRKTSTGVDLKKLDAYCD